MRRKKVPIEKHKKHLKLRQKIATALRLGRAKYDDWPPEPRKHEEEENTSWIKIR